MFYLAENEEAPRNTSTIGLLLYRSEFVLYTFGGAMEACDDVLLYLATHLWCQPG